MQAERIVLNFVEGSSAKTYQCQLEGAGDAWVVNFQYGRIGGSLATGSKTTSPVAYPKAKAIFDKLVREKKGKGYSETEDGRTYQANEFAGRDSGIRCQLLNPVARVDTAHVDAMIASPDWCMEIKLDGERRLIAVTDDGIRGINRKGLFVQLDDAIVASVAAGKFGIGTVLDGEDMGDGRYGIFDVLNLDGKAATSLPYRDRLRLRDEVVRRVPEFALIATAFTFSEKEALYGEALDTRQEGLVLKRLDAPYTAGRPNSGGTQLKAKFVETATVRVIEPNEGKRSVKIAAHDNHGKWMCIGNVTIPTGKAIPQAGAIIEIEYLFAYRGGSVYQPIYQRERPDQDASDCLLSQLKYVDERVDAAA